MSAKNVMVVVGTRPEAIKMAPVVLALKRRSTGRTILCSTGQHREMLDQVMEVFELNPDIDLALMKPGQDPALLTARVIAGMRDVLKQERPDAILVHGDTTSCLSAAMAAFYERIPVGHVEAGLRTYNFEAPYPEEMNRRLTDPICRWCFAPTELARKNLLSERIPEQNIYVTGNTVIDALLFAVGKVRTRPPVIPGFEAEDTKGRRLVMVTAHRRESFGKGFENLCLGLRDIADEHEDVVLVYPVHLNPNVQKPVRQVLGNHPRIRLIEPLPYLPFVSLMDRSDLIITDSGGIQEEAPSLDVPVLVMRETTERPEAVQSGAAKLVGTCRKRIAEEAHRLLTDQDAYKKMALTANPYGDGKSADRMVEILEGF